MVKSFLPVRPWTKKKLDFLRRYLQAYTKAIHEKGFSKCCYIDGFAGAGKNYLKETGEMLDGSALIAMNTVPPFTDYIFVELDSMNFLSLKKYVSEHPTCQKSHVWLRYGDCNWCLPREILPRIPSQIPVFAFLDPFGLEIKWTTIEEIARRKHVTILINFSYLGVKRQMSIGKNVLDNYYGTTDWAEIAKRRMLERLTAQQARKAFLNLYMSRLCSEFGYTNCVFLAKANDVLYYLLLASQNEAMVKITNFVRKDYEYSMA